MFPCFPNPPFPLLRAFGYCLSCPFLFVVALPDIATDYLSVYS